MRYPEPEKLENIRIVERSPFPFRRIQGKPGKSNASIYRRYDRYQTPEASGLKDRTEGPSRLWNRIPNHARNQITSCFIPDSDGANF